MNKQSKKAEQSLRSEYYGSQVQKFGKGYPSFHWPSVELLLNLIYTYDLISSEMEKYLNKYGLSRATFNLLMIVRRSEGAGCKQQEISKLSLVSRANITGLVDGLARQGLVLRTSHAHDRRVYIVKLSSQGEELLESLLPDYYAYVKKLCDGLSAAKKKEMNGLLLCLRQNIERD